jgi:hypothetical protein
MADIFLRRQESRVIKEAPALGAFNKFAANKAQPVGQRCIYIYKLFAKARYHGLLVHITSWVVDMYLSLSFFRSSTSKE